MRATLHDHAPNPYYGQWLREKAAVCGPESPAIAHNEVIASARFVTFDVPEGDFPGNRSPVRWKFAFRPKRKICAREVALMVFRTAGLQARTKS
jgi:hypothetical protein